MIIQLAMIKCKKELLTTFRVAFDVNKCLEEIELPFLLYFFNLLKGKRWSNSNGNGLLRPIHDTIKPTVAATGSEKLIFFLK